MLLRRCIKYFGFLPFFIFSLNFVNANPTTTIAVDNDDNSNPIEMTTDKYVEQNSEESDVTVSTEESPLLSTPTSEIEKSTGDSDGKVKNSGRGHKVNHWGRGVGTGSVDATAGVVIVILVVFYGMYKLCCCIFGPDQGE